MAKMSMMMLFRECWKISLSYDRLIRIHEWRGKRKQTYRVVKTLENCQQCFSSYEQSSRG